MSLPTANDLEEGVHLALEAGDVRAAVQLLEGLIAVDLPRGVRLYDEVQAAIAIARLTGERAVETEPADAAD